MWPLAGSGQKGLLRHRHRPVLAALQQRPRASHGNSTPSRPGGQGTRRPRRHGGSIPTAAMCLCLGFLG